MAVERKASQELSAALAKHVLDGIDSQKDDAVLAKELVSTLGDYADSMLPEDQKRFAEQVGVFRAFMAACRAVDRAHAEGDHDAMAEHGAEIKRLTEKSKQATKYLGLTDAAVALVKARDLGEFCSILPSVPLDRTYGSGLRGMSPFPLIWAISARSWPLERVKLMLEAGARIDLQAGLRETVLHAMARMNRKGKVRRPILELLVSSGADLQAQNIHGVTPLAAALDEGSEEDIRSFIEAGAGIGELELRFAAGSPERLSLVLSYVSWNPQIVEAQARFVGWLDAEIIRTQEHIDFLIKQRAGAGKMSDRKRQLTASREFVRMLP
jgi:hypothetical protein